MRRNGCAEIFVAHEACKRCVTDECAAARCISLLLPFGDFLVNLSGIAEVLRRGSAGESVIFVNGVVVARSVRCRRA